MKEKGTLLAIIVFLALLGLTGRPVLERSEAAASEARGKEGTARSSGQPSEEDPAAKRRSLERKLDIARVTGEQAELESRTQELEARQAIDQAQKDLEIAKAKLTQFRELDVPNRIAKAELSLARIRDAAEEAAEELKQIEIMYEEQDLEDRTAEFVVNRGRRNAERRKQEIQIEVRSLETLKGHELPRERATLELDVTRKEVALEKAMRDARSGALAKRIALMTAKSQVAGLEDELSRLVEAGKRKATEEKKETTEQKEESSKE